MAIPGPEPTMSMPLLVVMAVPGGALIVRDLFESD